jgi:D-sedoheptulose 7-phosphate isomerase
MGMTVIGMTGRHGGTLAPLCNILHNVPSTFTPIIQQLRDMVGPSWLIVLY